MILEALSLQTPVIATPAGGVCEEILKNKHGCVLARDASSEAIAGAIDAWVGGAPYKPQKYAMQNFHVSVVIKQYEHLFLRLIG